MPKITLTLEADNAEELAETIMSLADQYDLLAEDRVAEPKAAPTPVVEAPKPPKGRPKKETVAATEEAAAEEPAAEGDVVVAKPVLEPEGEVVRANPEAAPAAQAESGPALEFPDSKSFNQWVSTLMAARIAKTGTSRGEAAKFFVDIVMQHGDGSRGGDMLYTKRNPKLVADVVAALRAATDA